MSSVIWGGALLFMARLPIFEVVVLAMTDRLARSFRFSLATLSPYCPFSN